MFQRRGTAGVGAVFGPIMMVWFATLARARHPRHPLGSDGAAGAQSAARRSAFSSPTACTDSSSSARSSSSPPAARRSTPTSGISARSRSRSTGSSSSAPSLVLQYLGQGALLLRHPDGGAQSVLPARAEMGALSAGDSGDDGRRSSRSQAIISGVFSLTRQAIQLGYLPRMEIVHTSRAEIGQIYMPSVNWALMVATIAAGDRLPQLVESGRRVRRGGQHDDDHHHDPGVRRGARSPRLERVSRPSRSPSAFLIGDLAFLGANCFKIVDGGWFPLLIAAVVFTVMTTWRKGRQILTARLREGALSPEISCSRCAGAAAGARARHRRLHAPRAAGVIPPRCCTA